MTAAAMCGSITEQLIPITSMPSFDNCKVVMIMMMLLMMMMNDESQACHQLPTATALQLR
jgi:hypothetical protein